MVAKNATEAEVAKFGGDDGGYTKKPILTCSGYFEMFSETKFYW